MPTLPPRRRNFPSLLSRTKGNTRTLPLRLLFLCGLPRFIRFRPFPFPLFTRVLFPCPRALFSPVSSLLSCFSSVLLIKSISYDKPHHSSDPSSPLHFIHSHFPPNHLLTSPDTACQPSSPPVTSTAEQQSSRTKHGPAPPRPVLRLAALATTAVPVQKTNP